jgi:hypothetical protein
MFRALAVLAARRSQRTSDKHHRYRADGGDEQRHESAL